MSWNIFDVAFTGMKIVLILVVIGMAVIFLIGGAVHPLIKSLNPENPTGITTSMYDKMADRLWTGTRIMLYIFLALPFVFILIKVLYERENTSIILR